MRAIAATCTTARLKGTSLAFDGLFEPESLRMNCRKRIDLFVGGGSSKLNSVLMFGHDGYPKSNPAFLSGSERTRRRGGEQCIDDGRVDRSDAGLADAAPESA